MKLSAKYIVSMAVAMVLFVMGSSTVYAEDTALQFVSGTTINGIGVGGLTVEQAKERIEGFYDSGYKLTIKKKGGSVESIQGPEIGYKVTVPDGLQAILDTQNATGRNFGPSTDNSHNVEMKAAYDETALAARINGLACISGSDIVVTSDARISEYQEGQPFKIIPEVNGSNVDPEKVAALIKSAVGAGMTEVNLEEAGCYKTVAVNADSEQLKSLLNVMNQCREMTITYLFGEMKEPLPGEVICTWLTGAENGEIGVNRDLVAAYVAALAGKYDTAGVPRTFHTSTGRDVALTGPYGWRLDQAAEIDALVAMIKTGQSQEREPQYAQTAASRTAPDWGGTYVETDLTGQHVYMYQDGVLVWDAPCVTGNISKGHTTPEGIYSLTYKETDRILRGKKQADGSYEYESHVNYWMPFNGGIGFHDANWRSKFGGAIYQTNGSHGCINLPPKKGKELYGLIYKGIPVLCYN